ncbi:MAG: hypothetical protein ACRCV3_03760 [Desulfovibrionaceae bacterium]
MHTISHSRSSFPFYYKILLLSSFVVVCSFVAYGIYSYKYNVSVEETRSALTKLSDSDASVSRKDLENILTKAPNNMKAAVALDMGNIAMQEGKYQEAKESYAMVADSSDTVHFLGILGEAQALIELNQAVEAITILENLEKTLPEYLQSAVLFTLAQAQEEMNLKDAALQSYTKLLVMDIENKNYIQYRIQRLAAL